LHYYKLECCCCCCCCCCCIRWAAYTFL